MKIIMLKKQTSMWYMRGISFIGLSTVISLMGGCGNKEMPEPKIQPSSAVAMRSICQADITGDLAVLNGSWAVKQGVVRVEQDIKGQKVLVGSGEVDESTNSKSFRAEVVDDNLVSDCYVADVPLQVGVDYYLCPILASPITNSFAVYLGHRSDIYLVVRFNSANHGKLRFRYEFDAAAIGGTGDHFVILEKGANITVSTEQRSII